MRPLRPRRPAPWSALNLARGGAGAPFIPPRVKERDPLRRPSTLRCDYAEGEGGLNQRSLQPITVIIMSHWSLEAI